MRFNKKAVVIILVMMLVVGGAVGWSVWRKHATGSRQPDALPTYSATPSSPAAQPEQSPGQPEATASPLSDTQRQDRAATAISLEKTMRNWGTDPTLDLKPLAKQPVEQVAETLHTQPVTTNPLAGSELVAFTIDDDEGPTAPGMYCTDTSGNYEKACANHPTMGDWWSQEAWGYGTRWLGEPQASVNEDGTVRVTGQVRTFLVQDGDTFSGKYWALTPAWQTYEVDDTLTFDGEGKVTGVSHAKDNPWWIDPYMSEWDDDMPYELGETGERIAIPVVGAPPAVIKLSYMSGHRQLRGPGTMADLDGKVNWDLFTEDGECMASCGTGRQG